MTTDWWLALADRIQSTEVPERAAGGATGFGDFTPRPGCEASATYLLGHVRVDSNSGCWIWTGLLTEKGYGRFTSPKPRRTIRAHRASYETFVGDLDPRLTIDHVAARGCISKACINPAHLEQVTDRENKSRAPYANLTHCKNGHEFTPENTGRWVKNGGIRRSCKACKRARGILRRSTNSAARDEALAVLAGGQPVRRFAGEVGATPSLTSPAPTTK